MTRVDGKLPALKPVLVIWDAHVHPRKEKFAKRIKNFILKHTGAASKDYKILVSGQCESTMLGIEECVKKLLVSAFTLLRSEDSELSGESLQRLGKKVGEEKAPTGPV